MENRRLEPGRLVVASHNKGKLKEINQLLEPFGFEVVSAGDLDLPEPVEDGDTFEANAAIKALASAKASGYPALADDSGFCVEALDNDPGVYSARWAGPGKDFSVAMQKVEDKLQELGAENRNAYFVAVLCVAWPDGHTQFYRGEVHGKAIWPPRGLEGFGYDPMFVPDGFKKTFGEMDQASKQRNPDGSALSHRARAFDLFKAECL
ncbi:RdgB/HAM1 family non-canonical purine NTP pyrophosphatase [Pseudovibrio exalbescens]|uniref:RdgB/HAM1 family non-canonical purine NTP pyrophosphatase n=1 Tax=Pseudovibrio exalbescens TaxID=197461 RepID=UPI002365489C|nr:RdgB/HAM1 family non-canonical purine NTP pyrophosphatase [Pseudovibrio exalbescens]MDD7909570.1 RdgB/HAM1 family non-canonical purine NTP pyrophosphatase [Pseudovibrio exalbescens]